jgi:HPt (histidine-containing phosphotransfer) domain-containing protein
VQLRALKTTLERWLPRPGHSAMPAAPALDVTVLEQLIGHQPALVAEFLRTFEESAQQALGEVRQAAAVEDCKVLGAVGHRLKSSARSVGALPLAELCTELEAACKRGDTAAALRLAQEFEPAVAAVNAVIRAHRHQPEFQ